MLKLLGLITLVAIALYGAKNMGLLTPQQEQYVPNLNDMMPQAFVNHESSTEAPPEQTQSFTERVAAPEVLQDIHR